MVGWLSLLGDGWMGEMVGEQSVRKIGQGMVIWESWSGDGWMFVWVRWLGMVGWAGERDVWRLVGWFRLSADGWIGN